MARLRIALGFDLLALHLDIGIAAVDTVLGPVIGLVAFVLNACWRITTPAPSPAARWEAIGPDAELACLQRPRVGSMVRSGMYGTTTNPTTR